MFLIQILDETVGSILPTNTQHYLLVIMLEQIPRGEAKSY